MQSTQGFTLVEIIMVMVILSILAIVAAPRFINLQSSAYKVQQKNIIAAVNSTISLGQVKAAVDGVTDGKITINGQEICFVGGYPAVEWTAGSNASDEKECKDTSKNILGLMELDTSFEDKTVTVTDTNKTMKVTTSKDNAKTSPLYIAIAENCAVEISQTDTSKPKVKGLGKCSS